MGVYIRGMKAPKGCDECFISRFAKCTWCPFEDVGKHGRLIDADAYEYPGDLEHEPTIIEGSE